MNDKFTEKEWERYSKALDLEKKFTKILIYQQDKERLVQVRRKLMKELDRKKMGMAEVISILINKEMFGEML